MDAAEAAEGEDAAVEAVAGDAVADVAADAKENAQSTETLIVGVVVSMDTFKMSVHTTQRRSTTPKMGNLRRRKHRHRTRRMMNPTRTL